MLSNVDTRSRLLLISLLYLKVEGEVTWQVFFLSCDVAMYASEETAYIANHTHADCIL